MQNCFYLLFFSPFGAGRQNVLGCCCHCPFSKNCGICKVCTAGLCRQHQSCSWLCCLWISGENFISLRICYSVQCSGWNHWQGKIWATRPQHSVKIKISLPGLLNSAPWFWFSSFLMSCLVGECRSRNGYKCCELVSAEPTCSQRAVEFVLDCTAAGTARKAPHSQGWERWSPAGACVRAAGAPMPAGVQLLGICLLLLSPASTEPWAGTSTAGTEGSACGVRGKGFKF